jgi:hypothetical protein
MKALVAIDRVMLVAAHRIFTNGASLTALCADHFTPAGPADHGQPIRPLEALGLAVTVHHIT